MGTDEMAGLQARKDHHCPLKHVCSAELQLPSCASPLHSCSHYISHGFITKTDLLIPDLDKFWRPLALGQGPSSSQSSSANFSWGIVGAPASALLPAVPRSHVCPGSQGHVAEVGAATGPCSWSPVSWQMCALLGAVCNLHTKLPLLLRRAALTSQAASRAPASACLAP